MLIIIIMIIKISYMKIRIKSRSLVGNLPLRLPHPDPCEGFRCKRGKTCKLDANNEPGCVCQETSECPSTANDFDRVSTTH